MSTAAPPIPAVGQVVRCRGRAWLIDGIEPSPHGTILALSCLEDDSQREQANVIWQAELGTSIIDGEGLAGDRRVLNPPSLEQPATPE